MALSSAVMGTLIVPMAPTWFRPTEVVEQLLEAPASRPMDSEQRLIGASTLASGEDCFVVLVPVVAFCPGSRVLPISLASAVIGMEMETGSAVRGASGLVAGAAAGTAAGAAARPVVAGGAVTWATAAAVAFCTLCTVVCTVFCTVVATWFAGGDDAPAAGRPTADAAARVSPDVRTPIELSRLRLNVCSFCVLGNHRPALKPATFMGIPMGGTRTTAVTWRNFSTDVISPPL